jgi:alpha-L-arabinofuranosidase
MNLIADVRVSSRPVEITDDHYYSSPDFFMNAAGFYDTYKRGANKVYVGEYAVVRECGQGNLRAALGEASFMIGMERNADVVTMTSYAPLFVNVNDRRWNPNLIPFDADRSFGTPSYYVQKLFAHNRGDVVLPTITNGPVRPGAVTGGVGVGTWLTAAEFADIKVTGASLPALTKWKPSIGEWSIDGGIVRQSSLDADCRYTAYNSKWKDYTLSLRARKLSGAEGFLIMFRARDKGNWFWWNIGGWGNISSGVERCDAGGKTPATPQVPLAVETGRWYDIRVELKGPNVKCYLDGMLIHEFTVADTSLVSAIAVRDGADIVLKVVNASDEPWDAPISIENLGWKSARAHLTVLTAPSAEDENSLDDPEMIHPVEQDLGKVALTSKHVFPAHSLSILRFAEYDHD